jgi:hypothetical protein
MLDTTVCLAHTVSIATADLPVGHEDAETLAMEVFMSNTELVGAFTPHIGKQCIVRTYASGVFFGTVVKQDGRQVEMQSARRLWYWKATKGISLSAVAVNGIDSKESKVTAEVPSQTILDALEILPAEKDCILSIAATPAAEAR